MSGPQLGRRPASLAAFLGISWVFPAGTQSCAAARATSANPCPLLAAWSCQTWQTGGGLRDRVVCARQVKHAEL